MITELVLRLKPDGTFNAGHAGDQIDAIKAERDSWKENAKPERDRQRAKAMQRLAEAQAEAGKYT